MIYLGADHGGFDLKEKIKVWLTSQKIPFSDLGAHKLDPQDDDPIYAFKVADKISQEENSQGILLCRSAAGMVIAANKVSNIRAVSVTNVKQAKHSREHNDANIIALSGDWLSEEEACKILDTFLKTKFLAKERYIRRIQQVRDRERFCNC